MPRIHIHLVYILFLCTNVIFAINKPTLLRSVSTPSLIYKAALEPIQEDIPAELDIIVFRIDSRDFVQLWNGHVEYKEGYSNPTIGQNIIDYWMSYQLLETVEVYQEAKTSRVPQRLTRRVHDQHYVWYFTPNTQDDQPIVSGYVINIDFMYNTLNAAEKKYEDTQMLQNALTSHQTRYQCYNILMCLQSIQDAVPILKKTRINNIIDTDGRLLTHAEICDAINVDASKAHQFTSVLLKRQQQCEDIIACQHQTMKLDYKTFDIVELVKNVWKDCFQEAKRKDIKFGLQIQPLCTDKIPLIKQDEFRFKQICTTLIENAINFTPDLGEIHMYLGVDQNHIQFSVTDSGVGIEEEILLSHQQKMKLGQLSFSQPKPSAGLGLSLAIAQHIIELMCGTLEILTGNVDASSDGDTCSLEKSSCSFDFQVGTQIVVRIPYHIDTVQAFYSENPDSVQFERPKISTTKSSRYTIDKRSTIVVVDDDEVILRLWEKAIKQLGYLCHTINDGKPAVSYYESHHTMIALIIMDIQMPHNGLDATRQIRRWEEKMDLPCRTHIIANTASGASSSLQKECMLAGMQHFCTKPNSKKDIKRIIDQHAQFD